MKQSICIVTGDNIDQLDFLTRKILWMASRRCILATELERETFDGLLTNVNIFPDQ